MTDSLDVVILGATQIDTDFNINVHTDSDGRIMGGSGGHSDTAAGAKLAMIIAPLSRARLPIVTDRVNCISTPGSTIDVLVTQKGVGEAKENAKLLEAAVADMETITGQHAVVTKAKNSVANFKIREGQGIGCKTTLRGEKMYDFLDRLVNLALPRVRDFRGVNADSFDGRGNYALGIKEQIIFPEIEYDKVDKVRGMDVIVVTTAKTDEEARELLRLFGMPFAK